MTKKLLGSLLAIFMGILSVGIVAGQSNSNGYGNQDVSTLPAVPAVEKGLAGEGLLTTVQWMVNWALGLLGFLALIVLLWGGFLMITAAGDDTKYKKGFTILKQAAIGLIFIGVSWMIISIIFFVIGAATSSGVS